MLLSHITHQTEFHVMALHSNFVGLKLALPVSQGITSKCVLETTCPPLACVETYHPLGEDCVLLAPK